MNLDSVSLFDVQAVLHVGSMALLEWSCQYAFWSNLLDDQVSSWLGLRAGLTALLEFLRQWGLCQKMVVFCHPFVVCHEAFWEEVVFLSHLRQRSLGFRTVLALLVRRSQVFLLQRPLRRPEWWRHRLEFRRRMRYCHLRVESEIWRLCVISHSS